MRLSRHRASGPLAQLVEQLTFNQWVAGSNPARLTTDLLKNAIVHRNIPGTSRDILCRTPCGGGLSSYVVASDLHFKSERA